MKKKPGYTPFCIVNWEVYHAINKTDEKCKEKLKDLFKVHHYTFRGYLDSLNSEKEDSDT